MYPESRKIHPHLKIHTEYNLTTGINTMSSILILSELQDYTGTNSRFHYSLTKGFYLGIGFAPICDTYYMTLGKTEVVDGVRLINKEEITDEFLDGINILLFIREGNLLDIIEEIPAIGRILFSEQKKHKIGMKSDTLSWLYSKPYRKYFEKRGELFIGFVARVFDIICVQTEMYTEMGLEQVMKHHPDYLDTIRDKILVSRMGVPDEVVTQSDYDNPYDINHSYCCDNMRTLVYGKALHPLGCTSRNARYNRDKDILGKYNREKTIIIYIGRIKTDDGIIFHLMHDIMKQLGDDYELHIFPGRFVIPGSGVTVYSPKFSENLQLIRDAIFYDLDNVIIHYPVNEVDKSKYMIHAGIGIDFSSTRPENKKTAAGHAKLLEYCYYGLGVVADENIGNSVLVTNARNGILLEGIPGVDEYVDAIKRLAGIKFSREEVTTATVKTNGWKKIAEEIHDRFVRIQG